MLTCREDRENREETGLLNQAFVDYYRCPESYPAFAPIAELSEDKGFFRFGPDVLCHGKCSVGFRANDPTDELYDVTGDVASYGSFLKLPFSPLEVIDDLRHERYFTASGGASGLEGSQALAKAYYTFRPLLGVAVRKYLQRLRLRNWKTISFPQWPVDRTVEAIFESLLLQLLKSRLVDRVPFIWFWPNDFLGCAIMTHDVEASKGRNFCPQLMDLNDAHGIKSSFQIVPEGRYSVPEALLDEIRGRGFEINVHDLNHDGYLMSDKTLFLRRVKKINAYGRQFAASGFRSAVLYRNLDWYAALDFAYDMSVPNVGHLEAQRGGCCSVMPFFVGQLLELPVTTTQDYSLFHILKEYSIDLWKKQIALIMEKHGLASFIVHPDYIIEKQARDTYKRLLAYLTDLRLQKKLWVSLPAEVNQWWRDRAKMRLVPRGSGWQIEGPGSERARVAYAVLERGAVTYGFEAQS